MTRGSASLCLGAGAPGVRFFGMPISFHFINNGFAEILQIWKKVLLSDAEHKQFSPDLPLASGRNFKPVKEPVRIRQIFQRTDFSMNCEH